MSDKPGVDPRDPRIMSRDQLEAEVLASRIKIENLKSHLTSQLNGECDAIVEELNMAIAKLEGQVRYWQTEAERWIERNRKLEIRFATIREAAK